jgi:molybdopterin molybdotransferase
MPEFFNVLPPEQALAVLLERLPAPSAKTIKRETVPVTEALDRITAEAMRSPEDLPAYFTLVGEVLMGQGASVSVGLGEAATAYTGGMLAQGADAVVMVENTQTVDANTIEIIRPVAPGENVVQVG